MDVLSTPELLNVWETALPQPPVQRALTLLSATCSETPAALARLSVGQRDLLLLSLRECVFGSRMAGLAQCPACSERVAIEFNTTDLQTAPQAESFDDMSISIDAYSLRFRIPNSLDLATIADHKDAPAARHLLLDRCVFEAEHKGERISVRQLPPEVARAVEERMAQVDPQVERQIAISCGLCGSIWTALFDIASFLWIEIDAWANRVLKEVHTLASAYGWRELDILKMSPWRRHYYLTLLGV